MRARVCMWREDYEASTCYLFTLTCAMVSSVSRLMKLSIVHDLAESLVGDIVPHDTRYTKEQKRQLEEVRERRGLVLHVLA